MTSQLCTHCLGSGQITKTHVAPGHRRTDVLHLVCGECEGLGTVRVSAVDLKAGERVYQTCKECDERLRYLGPPIKARIGRYGTTRSFLCIAPLIPLTQNPIEPGDYVIHKVELP